LDLEISSDFKTQAFTKNPGGFRVSYLNPSAIIRVIRGDKPTVKYHRPTTKFKLPTTASSPDEKTHGPAYRTAQR
jgi:hypothetical protein